MVAEKAITESSIFLKRNSNAEAVTYNIKVQIYNKKEHDGLKSYKSIYFIQSPIIKPAFQLPVTVCPVFS